MGKYTFFVGVVAIAILLGGCTNTEKEWSKAKETNTVSAYRDFWARYATSEFAEEAYFRASMTDGSTDALIDYLDAFQFNRWKMWYLENEACDYVISMIREKSTSEVLEIMSRAKNSKLKDRLELVLIERDEETAWAVVQKVLSEGNVDEKMDICKKYLETYRERGIYLCEMKQIVEYVLSEKSLKEEYERATSYSERSRILKRIAENEAKRRLGNKPKLDASDLVPGPELKSPVRKKPVFHYVPHRTLADSLSLPEEDGTL